ncbi:MAG: hypothetical protein JNK82_21130 [Myxococcaceae bacterium]|nr:hypothetical protein [Myxococcaceae bacterium]
MTLRLVKPGEGGPPAGFDTPPSEGAPLPDRGGRRRARLIGLGVMLTLVLLGAGMLAVSVYVSREAEGYELKLEVGSRTTHVRGTNVTLTEGTSETKCVLSLVDFRMLRGKTAFLGDVTPNEKSVKGLPKFELALTDHAPPLVVSGALPMEQLEPIERFVILHASACIKTYEPPPKP